MKKLLCWALGHKLTIRKHIRGDIEHGVRLISCPRCNGRFIMSDEHRAFLRYDDDERFIADLLKVYPQLTKADL